MRCDVPPVCPPGLLDSDAIELALSRIARRLAVDYGRRLASLEFGTILELALVGRLLQKRGPFDVTPWPKESRVDIHLRKGGRLVEVEIKSSIATKYDQNVKRMCDLVRDRVALRWPGFTGEVNLFNRFREKEVSGHKTLDIEGTADDVMAEMELAVDADGKVTPTFRTFVPFRLVTKIEPLAYLKVWHSSYTLPGGHGEDVIGRTLKRALDDENQFSGQGPAVLVIIQARDPDARLLYRGAPSVADQYFARHPGLSAIIAVPCPSLNGPAVLITPDQNFEPSRTHPLVAEEGRLLIEQFAVQLQVDSIWLEVEEDLRRRVLAGESIPDSR